MQSFPDRKMQLLEQRLNPDKSENISVPLPAIEEVINVFSESSHSNISHTTLKAQTDAWGKIEEQYHSEASASNNISTADAPNNLKRMRDNNDDIIIEAEESNNQKSLKVEPLETSTTGANLKSVPKGRIESYFKPTANFSPDKFNNNNSNSGQSSRQNQNANQTTSPNFTDISAINNMAKENTKSTNKITIKQTNIENPAHSCSSPALLNSPEVVFVPVQADKTKDRNSTGITNISNSSGVSLVNNNDLKRQLESIKVAKEQVENKMLRLETESKENAEKYKGIDEHNLRLTKCLEDLYRTNALTEGRRRRDRVAADCVRLGKISTVLQGAHKIIDVWEEGYASKELQIKQSELVKKETELQKRRKAFQLRKRNARKGLQGSGGGGGGVGGSSVGMETEEETDLDLDLAAEEAAIRTHADKLKREEADLYEERKLLDEQKAIHLKELKRISSEDKSRFLKDLPCLSSRSSRYQLTMLLGRGGFSEVWKAMDLVEMKEVAVKVHQLSQNWSEDRKLTYIKHVTREYSIHRVMRHPRVVQLFDVFEIDVDSFATVLELCRGPDLDETLKRFKTLSEKESRTILLQILSGLRYLNTPSGDHPSSIDAEGGGGGDFPMPPPPSGSASSRRRGIIHFDLKPANILFDEFGDAKITDFGLSKIIDEACEGTSMELTSVGAGTYWYLPPEVFDVSPRISSKVDVWSIGIIYYQMLYGKRPYGDGMSQERVLGDRVIQNAGQVDFPPMPRVTEEAKDFIRDCLIKDQNQRPDVAKLCLHSYVRQAPKKI